MFTGTNLISLWGDNGRPVFPWWVAAVAMVTTPLPHLFWEPIWLTGGPYSPLLCPVLHQAGTLACVGVCDVEIDLRSTHICRSNQPPPPKKPHSYPIKTADREMKKSDGEKSKWKLQRWKWGGVWLGEQRGVGEACCFYGTPDRMCKKAKRPQRSWGRREKWANESESGTKGGLNEPDLMWLCFRRLQVLSFLMEAAWTQPPFTSPHVHPLLQRGLWNSLAFKDAHKWDDPVGRLWPGVGASLP